MRYEPQVKKKSRVDLRLRMGKLKIGEQLVIRNHSGTLGGDFEYTIQAARATVHYLNKRNGVKTYKSFTATTGDYIVERIA